MTDAPPTSNPQCVRRSGCVHSEVCQSAGHCTHGAPSGCMEDAPQGLVERLREDADAWAGPEGQNDYADTVLVEREAADEIERLNKWAVGFSDRQLEERRTGEAYQRELRAEIERLNKQLAKADIESAALRARIEAILRGGDCK